MLMVVVVIAVVSGALVLGALWGLYLPLPEGLQGFLVALAGGALVLSAVDELIARAVDESSLGVVALFTLLGAAVFTGVDYVIDEKWGDDSGGGLLAAITLDGVPENLALGVALIGADPKAVAALAGSILLSNLPEAAGGAKQMRSNGMSRMKALGLWAATALLLSAAALIGYLVMDNASPTVLAAIRSAAAGAVIASLATEVFPQAFKEDSHWAGIATTIGLLLALALSQLGN